MKKKLLGILGAFTAFFSSTSGIYNYDSVDPKTTNDNYLTFTNNSNSDVYVQLYKNGSRNAVSLICSTDNASTWHTFLTDNSEESIYRVPAKGNIKIAAGTSKPGDYTNTWFSYDTDCYYQFKWYDSSKSAELTNAVISASGDVTSLLNGKGGDVDLTYTEGGTTDYRYCFVKLFLKNKCLTSTPNLPSTKLAAYCYNYMFTGCISLVTISFDLPAVVLPRLCYHRMFAECTALKKIPNLSHVTSIGVNSVYCMFAFCYSLTITNGEPGNWAIGNKNTGGEGDGTYMFSDSYSVVCNPTPTVGQSYHLSYEYVFENTSVGGYYMDGSTKKQIVAFGTAITGEKITTSNITKFGVKVYSDFGCSTEIIDKYSTNVDELINKNGGRFYYVYGENESISENTTYYAKAYVVNKDEETEYSGVILATGNNNIEYTL